MWFSLKIGNFSGFYLTLKDYTPSPYEKSHVALKKGQLVTVLEMQSMGKWYGQVHAPDGKVEFDRKGLFPFNRVEAVSNN